MKIIKHVCLLTLMSLVGCAAPNQESVSDRDGNRSDQGKQLQDTNRSDVSREQMFEFENNNLGLISVGSFLYHLKARLDICTEKYPDKLVNIEAANNQALSWIELLESKDSSNVAQKSFSVYEDMAMNKKPEFIEKTGLDYCKQLTEKVSTGSLPPNIESFLYGKI